MSHHGNPFPQRVARSEERRGWGLPASVPTPCCSLVLLSVRAENERLIPGRGNLWLLPLIAAVLGEIPERDSTADRFPP